MQRRVPSRMGGVVVVTLVWAAWLSPVADARQPVQRRTQHAVSRASGAAMIQPGEVLVTAARAQGLERAASAVGGRVQRALGRGVHVVKVAPGHERAAAARLAQDPAVATAEPSYFRTAASHEDSEMGWGVKRLEAPTLWSRPTPLTGAGVKIAVVDSGVEGTHPDLAPRVEAGKDVTADPGNGVDLCGHGTAVAGVAAADHDGSGLAGVAHEATIVPVKVLAFSEFFGVCGSGDAELIEGLNWVAGTEGSSPRADIINMSLSGPGRSRALGDAVNYAASRGVLIIGAAGNDGSITVNYPAAYRNVLSVGGVERDGDGGVRWWPFSSFGAVDVVAPGKGVPVIEATTRELEVGRPCTVGGAQRTCSDGTSFAAPHVAGLAALLVQHHPELAAMSASQRIQRLRQWVAGPAIDVEGTSASVDLHTGHGIPIGPDAADASVDGARTLLSWQVGGRILSPWRRETGGPLTMQARLLATTGTGDPLTTAQVAFTTSDGASVSDSSDVVDGQGRADTVLRSSVDGRRSRLRGTLDSGPTLRLDVYVLDRDDNIPGQPLRPTPYSDSLNLADDFDDVSRVMLRNGETMQARVSGLGRGEDVAVYLHRGSTTNVANPSHPPLREDSQAFEDDWTALKRTVDSDGVRYLHLEGFGTYRMRWWIESPGKLRNVDAAPATFTPNGDGDKDRTVVTWRSRQPGFMNVRIRNSSGFVVERKDLGRVRDGAHAIRWNGRNTRGNLVRAGRYRITLNWANGLGRIDSATTRVTVDR